MYHKVKSYIEEHHMINHGDVVLAGVSGGGDSMAMLDMLRKYSQEVPFSLCAVHVHHGIRGEEADRDEALSSYVIVSPQIMQKPALLSQLQQLPAFS